MFVANSKQGLALRDFYTMLAVCHTVMVEKDKATENGAITVSYTHLTLPTNREV